MKVAPRTPPHYDPIPLQDSYKMNYYPPHHLNHPAYVSPSPYYIYEDHRRPCGSAPPSVPRVSDREPVYSINDNDILMGRGGKNNQHVGNERLRELARAQAHQYNGTSKKVKGIIARDLVVAIRSLTPPGRFLKRTSASASSWVDVGDELAREKASQVLRDAVALVCDMEDEETGAGVVEPPSCLDQTPQRPRRVSQETSNIIAPPPIIKKRRPTISSIDSDLDAAAAVPPPLPVPTLARIMSGPCKKRRVSNFFETYAFHVDANANATPPATRQIYRPPPLPTSNLEPPLLVPIMSTHSASLLAPLLQRGDSSWWMAPPPPPRLERRLSLPRNGPTSAPPMPPLRGVESGSGLDSLSAINNNSGHSLSRFVESMLNEDEDDAGPSDADQEFYSEFC